jgi:hypothetical protein
MSNLPTSPSKNQVGSELSELSETFTNQRQEGTCAYHALAKIVVQNVFQFFIPSEVDTAKYKRNNCNRYVDFDIFNSSIASLSPSICSAGGYERILQFLYVYHLVYDLLNPRGGRAIGYAVATFGVIEYTTVTKQIIDAIFVQKIPTYFNNPHYAEHKNYLLNMLWRLDYVYGVSKMKFDNCGFYFPRIIPAEESTAMFKFVKTCISKKLFLLLGLRDFYGMTDTPHARHAVHIVSTTDDKVKFKNSWGGNEVHEFKLDGTVKLSSYVFRAESLFVLYPNTASSRSHEILDFTHADIKHLTDCTADIAAVQKIPKELVAAPFFFRGETVQFGARVGLFLSSDGVNARVQETKVEVVPVLELKKTDARLDSQLQQLVDFDQEQVKAQREKIDELIEHEKSMQKFYKTYSESVDNLFEHKERIEYYETHIAQLTQVLEKQTEPERLAKVKKTLNETEKDLAKWQAGLPKSENQYRSMQLQLIPFNMEEDAVLDKYYHSNLESKETVRERKQLVILEQNLTQSTYAANLANAPIAPPVGSLESLLDRAELSKSLAAGLREAGFLVAGDLHKGNYADLIQAGLNGFQIGRIRRTSQ